MILGFFLYYRPCWPLSWHLRTRQVYISLVLGIWLGWLIISDWNPVQGTLATLEGFVEVFQNPGNTRTIMFSALVGALLIFIQYSGGVQGFIIGIDKLLNHPGEEEGREKQGGGGAAGPC